MRYTSCPKDKLEQIKNLSHIENIAKKIKDILLSHNPPCSGLVQEFEHLKKCIENIEKEPSKKEEKPYNEDDEGRKARAFNLRKLIEQLISGVEVGPEPEITPQFPKILIKKMADLRQNLNLLVEDTIKEAKEDLNLVVEESLKDFLSKLESADNPNKKS